MLFDEYNRDIYRRTDRLFAWLMGFQWIAGIIFALWVSPLAWSGNEQPDPPARVGRGRARRTGSVFPALLAVLRPGQPSTRYTIAVAQMLMSALLIHLTGGRIETHFHVFGSLAFLAFYRDWRVLIPATVVVALDHMLRGHVLAAIRVRRRVHEPVALGGARGLGRLRGRLPRRLVSPEHRGNA